LIKRRAGDETTQDVVARTEHNAVKTPDASGMSTNTLELRVLADKIEYRVNNTVVHTTLKSGMTAKTEGLYGVRVNHQLEVRIDGLTMSKL
jgi:hypothetical protein